MMKTLKKALSVFLAVALLACLCIGMGMTGYAAGETITAEAVGTYNQSDAEQDVTIRISINGLSEPYCGFYIDDGVELPTGWTLKSYSTSNTAQPVTGSDYNRTNGKLNYVINDDEMTNSIPADTYYEAVITAPVGASGDFSIVFKSVICTKDYGAVELASAATVTAIVKIKGSDPDPDPTPTPEPAEGYTVTVAANKTTAAVNDTVEITLDVTNSDSAITTFNSFYGTLTYNATVFTYAGNDTIGNFEIDYNDSGKLKIARANSNVTIPGSGAELTLPFTAAATGTGTFELSDAKVSIAANANGNAPDATVVGKPSVPVSQKYNVTFVGGDGATGTAPTQDPVPAGTKITLPAANTFTKEGYTFVGWLCKVDNEIYNAGASYTMTAANTTFEAQWTETATATASIVSGYLDGYTLIKVTVSGTMNKTPTYDGNVMFTLSGTAYDADAYYYVVNGTVNASTAQSKLGWSDAAAMTLTLKGDANQTGLIDINDAQFVYNLYGSSVSYTYEPKAAQLLASDVNGDGSVDTLDCAAAIAAIK